MAQNDPSTLTASNLFEPANANHLAAIRKAFSAFDLLAIQKGVEQGDEDAIECAQLMIGYHQRAWEMGRAEQLAWEGARRKMESLAENRAVRAAVESAHAALKGGAV